MIWKEELLIGIAIQVRDFRSIEGNVFQRKSIFNYLCKIDILNRLKARVAIIQEDFDNRVIITFTTEKFPAIHKRMLKKVAGEVKDFLLRQCQERVKHRQLAKASLIYMGSLLPGLVKPVLERVSGSDSPAIADLAREALAKIATPDSPS